MTFGLNKYFDAGYFFRFVLILLVLYYFNIFYNGLTIPGGKTYSSFVEHHLNYLSWFTSSILFLSNLITVSLGLPSYVDNDTIRVFNGSFVTLLFPCLGTGITSFWIAFVVADSGSWMRKILWCVVGFFSIWFINSWRIALLLLSIEDRWRTYTWVDHHTLFNFATYLIIIVLMYLYTEKQRQRQLVQQRIIWFLLQKQLVLNLNLISDLKKFACVM